jgi:hypothetical protein
VWKEVVDKEFDMLDKARTCDVVDNVERGKEVVSKWILKMKRLTEMGLGKFKARLVALSFTKCLGFRFDTTSVRIISFDFLWLLLPLWQYKGDVPSKWMHTGPPSMVISR